MNEEERIKFLTVLLSSIDEFVKSKIDKQFKTADNKEKISFYRILYINLLCNSVLRTMADHTPIDKLNEEFNAVLDAMKDWIISALPRHKEIQNAVKDIVMDDENDKTN